MSYSREDNGSKLGLGTEEEIKFFGNMIAKGLPIGGFLRVVAGWLLPNILHILDDKFGDKLKMPWQRYGETLVTKAYAALNDGVLTKEEEKDLIEFCTKFINLEVNIPRIGEQEEELIYVTVLKFGAAVLRKLLILRIR